MAKIKRGVSLYSYQQTQFFKELDLEGQIKEVGTNLYGADGIEIINEQAIRKYPFPDEEFFYKWDEWMEKYQTKPVTYDAFFCDVLMPRDHVMSYSECADLLKMDIRLAKRLGFKNLRAIATTPLEILIEALPVAEECDIRIGKEIHMPIPIDGQIVNELVEYCEKTGTKHLGLIPDMGIFCYRPSEVKLDWYIRHGAHRETCDLVTGLCVENFNGKSNELSHLDTTKYSAGIIESLLGNFLKTGDAPQDLIPVFSKIQALVQEKIKNYNNMDMEVMAQSLLLSRTDPKKLKDVMPYIFSIHGKFYNMSEIPGNPGHYQDISIDYEDPLKVLKECEYDGYIDSEYEGQRNFQDLPKEQLSNEVNQVRMHQEMLKRLIGE
jgi:hypothetical protein